MEVNKRAAAEAEAFEEEWDPVYGQNGGYEESTRTLEHSPKVPCGRCPRAPRLLSRRFDAFFQGKHLPCPTCGRALNLWMRYRNTSSLEPVAGFVGARGTSIDVRNLPVGPVVVDLTDHGIPHEASIASLRYTLAPSLVAIQDWHNKHGFAREYPSGEVVDEEFGDEPWRGFAPTVFFGSSSPSSGVTTGDQLPRSLSFVHHAPSPSGVATDLQLRVKWFDTHNAPAEWATMFDAFCLALGDQLGPALVLANAAVESKLLTVLEPVILGVAGRDAANRLLTEVPYSHHLRAILPIVAQLSGWPPLSGEIAGQLNALRRRRNDFAHRETAATPATRDEVSKLMVAAAFGLHYLRYVRGATITETA